jgi:hypothetical protein
MTKAILLPAMLLRQTPRLWEQNQPLVPSSHFRMTVSALEAVMGADLGSSDREEIANRLSILLAHLLKWEFQPEGRTDRWQTVIRMQRMRIAMVIISRPSLARYPRRILIEQYRSARGLAAIDTGLRRASFPQDCPYSAAEALDTDYLPAAA